MEMQSCLYSAANTTTTRVLDQSFRSAVDAIVETPSTASQLVKTPRTYARDESKLRRLDPLQRAQSPGRRRLKQTDHALALIAEAQLALLSLMLHPLLDRHALLRACHLATHALHGGVDVFGLAAVLLVLTVSAHETLGGRRL